MRRLTSTDEVSGRRRALVRRLLGDETLAIEDRVAGLLVLLFGQPLPKVSRRVRDQIVATTEGHGSRWAPARWSCRNHSPTSSDGSWTDVAANYTFGRSGDHPWLFLGRPGRLLSEQRLRVRLRRVGVEIRAGRNSALMELASKLQAVVLSKLVGIHVTTEETWANQVGVAEASYAAEVAKGPDGSRSAGLQRLLGIVDVRIPN
jgi:hypothetical protein